MIDLLLLPLLEAPQPPSLVEPPAIIEQVPPPKPIIEVIDPNGCEPAMYWAQDPPHYCIPKNTTTITKTSTRSPQNGSQATSGWYPKGQCTWYISTRRPVGQWNDATDWKWQAQRDGYTVSSTPIAGAIGWTYGHVVYVESVNGDGTVTISEANYDYRGSIRTIDVPVHKYTYIY